MKITLINGSARANGSCSFILDKMISAFDKNGIDTKKYNISQMNIAYCCGYKHCYENGKCIKNDDTQAIVSDILTSDYVVIATPSYWADVPAQLKTFFDRNTPYGDTNPNRILKAEKEIKGIGIVVRAGKNEKENEVILNFIDHYYGHLGITPFKRFSIREVDSLDDLIKKQSIIDEIYNFSSDLE